jgi:hypothetical protein
MNYVLKVVGPTGLAYNSFQWPLEVGAKVEAPDWSPKATCGNGLHGWLNGQGDLSAANFGDDSKWLVLSVDDYIHLGGKIKFKTCEILFVGDMIEACKFLYSKLQPEDVAKSIGYVATGTIANSGQLGTSTSGDYGTSTSGDYGTSTSGNYGTSTSGEGGTSTSGNYGTSISEDYGTSISGDYGTSISGDYGTSTSGDWGTSISGDHGTSTSGDYGTSTSGDHGTSTSGELGEIRIRYWDKKAARYRTKVGYVGEDGIKANTPYKLNEQFEFVEW